MKKIKIYHLGEPPLENTLQIPVDSKILHVDIINGIVNLWVEIETEVLSCIKNFYIIDSNGEIPQHAEHLGTFIEGYRAWHAYMDTL